MKKIVCILAIVIMVLSASTVLAADIDLSEMSYDELIALKDALNLAIWNSKEWQEVKVPQGLWKVGEDIPAGHWSIEATADNWANIKVGTELNEMGKSIKRTDRWYYAQISSETYIHFKPDNDITVVDVELRDGDYVQIESASVIFKPYSGKPELGFK